MTDSKPNFPKIKRGRWEVVQRGRELQVCLWVGKNFLDLVGELFCGYTVDPKDIQLAIDEAVREYEQWLGTRERKARERQSLSKEWGVPVVSR